VIPLRPFFRLLLGVLLLLASASFSPASATVGPFPPSARFTNAYDSNGNTTNSAGNTYRYDPLNRLTNAVVGGNTISIVYDGDGNRVRKTVNGAVTLYLVDNRNPTGYAQVVEENTVSGGVTNLSRVYALGFDLFAQRTIGGSAHYFGYDGHGSTRFLTGTNAAVTDTYRYDAYGTLIASTGSTVNHYRYTGEQWDADLGMGATDENGDAAMKNVPHARPRRVRVAPQRAR
jgi:YD repeat-containing protein